MLARIKNTWNQLKSFPPGTRFEAFHRSQEGQPPWIAALYIVLAAVSFVVGVILAFIPGPAVVFFALSAGLVATRSVWMARWMDRMEARGRKLWASYRGWRKRRRRHHGQNGRETRPNST